jgi:hypothetical protein
MSNVRQERAIEKVAAQYRSRGYDVIVEPTPRELPEWLSDFRPDILARSDQEQVVVEVKAANAVRGEDWLAFLADAVGQHEGWRFEFVNVPGPRRTRTTEEPLTVVGSRHVQEYADAARELEKAGYKEQAFVLAWTAFEGAFRTAFDRDRVKVGSANPTSVLKTLWSMGYLPERSDQNRLERLWEVRNRLVHGYTIDYQSEGDIDYLLELSSRLLAESG